MWVRINLVRAKSLYIGAFYRPPDTDFNYLAQLDTSLSRLPPKNSCNIWLGGDFNAPHVKWETQEVKQEAGGKKALYQQLVDISLDHNLEQVVNIPKRDENILDLMFTNNRSGLNKVSTLPPLGKVDPDIRGRAKAKISTGLEGRLYLKVTGPPPKSPALIFIIKMSDSFDQI